MLCSVPVLYCTGKFSPSGGRGKRRKEKEKNERKKKEKKEKRRFSQWWTWRINISFFITFGVFCWLDLKFKGCFVFKYFSPRRHYVLNLLKWSISNDFFWGSCTSSFFGSLVDKIFNFLCPQEFWELPKGCHSLIKCLQITHVKWGLQRFLPQKYTILYPKIRMSGQITWDHSTMLYARVPRADKCHAVENMGMARVYVIGWQVRDFCVSTVQLKQTEFCRSTLWKYTKYCDASWTVRAGHSQN